MIELGYWKIRGLVGGARVMLEHAGAEWNETFYEAHQKEDGSWDRSEWTNVKATPEIQKNFAFPNLPWLKDGDVCISQSTAILKVRSISTLTICHYFVKYIARKFDIGQNLTDKEAWRVDQGADQIVDVRGGFVGLCYGFR